MISIVIPAYNEESRIGDSLKKIIDYFSKRKEKYEIIVVNDGSKDKTVDVVKKFKKVKLINNSTNKGKGFAVKNGVSHAKGDYILFSDADLSTPIQEFEKLISQINKYDVVIGSRRMKGANIKKKQPFHRRFLGKGFGFVVQLLAVWGIDDTQCGFKLFKKEIAKRVFNKQTINGWAFDVEILFITKKLGYKIKEVPVIWIDSAEQSKLKSSDAIPMFIELLKIRFNWIRGKY